MRIVSVAGLICASVLLPAAVAQDVHSIFKQRLFTQTSAAPPELATTQAFGFEVRTPAEFAVTTPNGTALALSPRDGGLFHGVRFDARAALDAAFPSGSYQFSNASGTSQTVPLSGDLYPAPSTILGGGWNIAGQKMVDPLMPVNVQFVPFPGYRTAGVAGQIVFQVFAPGETAPTFAVQAMSVPLLASAAAPAFSRVTIPAGHLRPGTTYTANLEFRTITAQPGSVFNAGYATQVRFNILALSGPGTGGGIGGSGPENVPGVASPPSITRGPIARDVLLGQTLTLDVAASGTAPLFYQWFKASEPIVGATGDVFTIPNAQTSDSGRYSVEVRNNYGAITAGGDNVNVVVPAPRPIITQHPIDQAVSPGGTVTLRAIGFAGGPPIQFQWFKNGQPVSGASQIPVLQTTQSTLTLTNVQASDAGTYYAVASTPGAAPTATAAATVTVGAPSAPTITVPPASAVSTAGGKATFVVHASGIPTPSLQWSRNGTPIPGATNSTLALFGLQPADTGVYHVTVFNNLGAITSPPVPLTLAPPANPGRVTNLSIRSSAGAGADTLIAGFTVGGSAAAQPLVLRAVGPTLRAFGVATALADPQISIHTTAGDRDIVYVNNDNWNGNPALGASFAAVGAFALETDSRDAGLFSVFPSNSYTAHVSPAGSSTNGVALVEVYEAVPSGSFTASSPRLLNLSARNHVGTGADILIAGFTVSGSSSVRLLIRGIGPALAAFGVGGVLSDPRLEVHTVVGGGDVTVAQNDNWGADAGLLAAFSAVGAFALPTSSNDAALVVTLQPGSYTAQLAGANNGTGVGLIEVYQLP